MQLPDGWVAVVKRDCPTCVLVEPVLQQLAAAGPLTVYSQDDPGFPDGRAPSSTTPSSRRAGGCGSTTVPTLLRVEDGAEGGRTVGLAARARGRR